MTDPMDRAKVQNVAKLARLTLRDEELPLVTEQLVKILAHVEKLSEVDTEGVEPTAQVGVDRLPLREDVVRPSLPREIVLREAPDTAGGGFVVPAFIEE